MSSNLPYKQAANVERRTWDKQAYEDRAKARLEAENDGSDTQTLHKPVKGDSLFIEVEKEEFQRAEEGAIGPLNSKRAFLKARANKVDLESKLGKTEVISSSVDISDGVKKSATGLGWHCRVCDCYLKDSLTYLDHINGKKHQRNLGYSMRTAKSTASEVVSKLDELAKAQEIQKREGNNTMLSHLDGQVEDINLFDELVTRRDKDLAKRKEERKRRREERKLQQNEKRSDATTNDEEQAKEDDDNEVPTNTDIAALMGFSSFS